MKKVRSRGTRGFADPEVEAAAVEVWPMRREKAVEIHRRDSRVVCCCCWISVMLVVLVASVRLAKYGEARDVAS